MTRILIAGAKGRMGQALLACAPQHPHLEIVAAIDAGDDPAGVLGGCDAVLDFSVHTATPGFADLCAARGKALVIGVTGHTEAERSRIVAQQARIPIVMASNFSTGVNALFWLARRAAEILGPGFDLEIIETHHRLKQDAPSGTARTLAEILAAARGRQLAQIARHGREGLVGARPAEEIGLHAVRGGDVVGDHTVLFAGLGERLELTHRASSRETFAHGALRAAAWAIRQPPGFYSMLDVLGLR